MNPLFFVQVLFLCLGTVLVGWAQAEPLTPYGHSFYSSGLYSGRMEAFALGPSCSSLRLSQSPWPCQPANLAGKEKSDFYAGLLIGDDVGTVDENRRLLSEDDNLELVRNLFDESGPVRMEATLSFAASWGQSVLIFMPYRYSYHSVVQNRFYPELSLYAVEERSLTYQYGFSVDEHLNLGFQVRGLQSKWIIGDIFLFDTLIDDVDSLRVKEQKALFFEPGATYTFTGDWKFRLTAFLKEFGYVEDPRTETAKNLAADFGLAFSPPVSVGLWDIGLVYELSDRHTDEEEDYTLGSAYLHPDFHILASLAYKRGQVAFLPRFGNLGLGILYKREELQTSYSSDEWEDSFFFELRALF